MLKKSEASMNMLRNMKDILKTNLTFIIEIKMYKIKITLNVIKHILDTDKEDINHVKGTLIKINRNYVK